MGSFDGTSGIDRRGCAGFTLVELLVALAVVAVVAALAYPMYSDQMKKGRRAAAQAFLVEVASRQQQYLIDARNYAVGAGAIAALSLTVPPEVAQFYTVNVEPEVVTNPPTYRLVAAPVEGSDQASDGSITLDQEGSRTRGGVAGW